MLRRVAGALVAVLVLGSCAVSNPRSFTGRFEAPAENSRVLLMTPDIQLALLTAGGVPEPRADWSTQGRDNLASGVSAFIERNGHRAAALDPTTAMDGRVGQIIRLHGAVSQSIGNGLYVMALPTKKDTFEWTLGPGVQELGTTYEADYALFVSGQGTFASGGRVATAVALSMLGVGVTLGSQVVTASLVDLRTGNVIWSNGVLAAPGQDMREPAGAAALIETLMKQAPL